MMGKIVAMPKLIKKQLFILIYSQIVHPRAAQQRESECENFDIKKR
jgi:hypothetical protein